MYAWFDTTLRELVQQIVPQIPDLPDPVIGTRFAFRSVFPDAREERGRFEDGHELPRFTKQDLGSVIAGEDGNMMDNKHGAKPNTTLREAHYLIGDYVTVAIAPPLADGSIAPQPGQTDHPMPRNTTSFARYTPAAPYRGRGGSMRGRGGFDGMAFGGVPSGECESAFLHNMHWSFGVQKRFLEHGLAFYVSILCNELG